MCLLISGCDDGIKQPADMGSQEITGEEQASEDTKKPSEQIIGESEPEDESEDAGNEASLPAEQADKEPEKTDKEVKCTEYDEDREACLSHTECKWMQQDNICEPVDKVDGPGDVNVPDNLPSVICNKLPLSDELNPGDRLYCLAVVNHNTEFCQMIEGDKGKIDKDAEDLRNLCFAVTEADTSYCKKNRDESFKHVCYYQIAVTSENIDFCDEITYDPHEREECYFNFVSNLYWWGRSDDIKEEYCRKFNSAEQRNTCLAFREMDVSACKSNVNCITFFEQPMSFCSGKGKFLKECVRDRAMTSRDISVCDELSGEKRDDCIGDFCTHIDLDIALCDKITNNIEKQSRYVEVAINLANGVRENS